MRADVDADAVEADESEPIEADESEADAADRGDIDSPERDTADSVERALDAFRAGEPVCVHDFADREGETDIVYPASAVDAEAVAPGYRGR